MALVKDATATKTHASGSPISWNHTVANKPNRILVVVVGPFGDGSSTSVTSVTYNGDALTKAVGSTTAERNAQIWYRLNPDTGTHAISVSGSWDYCTGGSVSFYNAAQLAPETGSNSGSGTSSSVTITPNRGNSALVGCVKMETNSTITAGQTNIIADEYSGTYEYGICASYTTGKSGSSSLTWTNENKSWVSYGVAIMPTTSGGGFLFNLL
jgi:hypothetical protein